MNGSSVKAIKVGPPAQPQKRKKATSAEERDKQIRMRNRAASIDVLTRLSASKLLTRTEVEAQQAILQRPNPSQSRAAQQGQMPTSPNWPQPPLMSTVSPWLRPPSSQHLLPNTMQLLQTDSISGPLVMANPPGPYTPPEIVTNCALWPSTTPAVHSPSTGVLLNPPAHYTSPVVLVHCETGFRRQRLQQNATPTKVLSAGPALALKVTRTVLRDTNEVDQYKGPYRLAPFELYTLCPSKKSSAVVRYVIETYFRNRDKKARNPELQIQYTRNSFEAVNGRGYEFKNGVISLVIGPHITKFTPNVVQINIDTITKLINDIKTNFGWKDPLELRETPTGKHHLTAHMRHLLATRVMQNRAPCVPQAAMLPSAKQTAKKRKTIKKHKAPSRNAYIKHRIPLRDTKQADPYQGPYILTDAALQRILHNKKNNTKEGRTVVKYVIETYFRNRDRKARNPLLDIQHSRNSFGTTKFKSYEIKNGVISLVEGDNLTNSCPGIVRLSCRSLTRVINAVKSKYGWKDPI